MKPIMKEVCKRGEKVKVRMEEKKVILELDIAEYFNLAKLLEEVSKFRGTGTGLRARELLEKIQEATKE